jgi:hypothetical protein
VTPQEAGFVVKTFAELVREKYLGIGFNREQAISKLYTETGVCRSSLRAALEGTRVKSETARSLCEWAAKVHHVDLDFKQLVLAPEKPARAKSTLSSRARAAIEAAVHDACLPATLTQCLVTIEMNTCTWKVELQKGGKACSKRGDDLREVLAAARDEIVEMTR